MTLALPPLASRAVALAILFLLIGGVYLLIADPLLSEYQLESDSVDDLTAALVRYRAAGLQLPAREATLKSLQSDDSAREGFLQGGNDNLIAGNIQTRIKSVAESAHGELRSTQILPATDDGKLHRIAIRAQMTVTLEAAQKVIYGIESGTPYLFIDNLTMNARTGPRVRAEEDLNPLIDMQFDVYGYTRSGTVK